MQIKTRQRVRDLAEVYTHTREVTAMLDLANLLSRYLQEESGRPYSPNVNLPLPIPSTTIPQFWGSLSRRGLWGAERLVTPGGHAYYREIGVLPPEE